MVKLLVILLISLLLALGMLGLHHHRMELTAQAARICEQIRQKELVLADQRVGIAKATNPLVLAANLKAAELGGGGIPPQPDAPLGGLPADSLNADVLPSPHAAHGAPATRVVYNVSRHRSIH